MNRILLLLLLAILFSCTKNNSQKNIYYDKAKEFRDASITDSAYYYFNIAKNSFLESHDSSGVGRSLVNMAILQQNKGDYYGSIETSLEANKYLRKTQDSIIRFTLGSNYNNMGICSSYLYDFDNSVKFYTQALRYVNDPESKYLYSNNFGDVLTTLRDYKQAQQNFKIALQTVNKINYARALNNLAKAKYYENKNYNPLPEFSEALKIRQEQNDPYAQNSSYATLSEYFFDKDKAKSLDYARKMLEISIQNRSKEDQLQALQKIINLDSKNYLNYFRQFQILNDSVQISKSKAKNQFAVVRYDVELKNTENEKLKTKSFKQDIGIAALLLSLIGGWLWYKKRRKILQQEKELEIKNTQLKLSKKVHDVVANGIYQVMTKIENQESFSKDEALDELEFVYEKSRDISYEKTDLKNDERNFSEKISELIGSFNNNNVNTYLAGNDESIWMDLKESTFAEVYQVCRELLVNMKKHSKADRVVFRFEKENNLIKIYYTDNGIGIPGDVIYKNGLSSTVSRIETIKGEIIFDTKTERGLKINISFPVS
ncbi:histidine kinase [Chryseobacterium sp. T16E-39]|uniref:tetratricopeptide repeat-containing sensor histidine kinase n=1 Tax=Chryseobacterium sp. T16E-39 TaxID=2015076 RepID=UPI000B5B4662|nr:tetratricopeptide repeat-containing sensor histidine kinase [Chryseobacterium sp. T16E-39]ASK31136.1 histidine kinase [Chryseobacterium sp. T16E-39]